MFFMKIITLTITINILLLSTVFSQEPIDNATVKVGFVILKCTINYDEAFIIAKKSAKQLGIKLNLRALHYNNDIGITFSKKYCEVMGYPCYIARGRYDDGTYISIEHSIGFDKLKRKNYIVIAASYANNNHKVEEVLHKCKKMYKSAYAKYSDVYMGCIH